MTVVTSLTYSVYCVELELLRRQNVFLVAICSLGKRDLIIVLVSLNTLCVCVCARACVRMHDLMFLALI